MDTRSTMRSRRPDAGRAPSGEFPPDDLQTALVVVPTATTGATEPLITDVDVALWLGCPRSMVRLLRDLGDLPAVRIGRLCRYRRSDVQALSDAGGARARRRWAGVLEAIDEIAAERDALTDEGRAWADAATAALLALVGVDAHEAARTEPGRQGIVDDGAASP